MDSPPPELRLEAKDMQYLLYVKALGNEFPHLRFLSDFMEVGTVPRRWDNPEVNPDIPDLHKYDDLCHNVPERVRRQQKTKVCRLNYFSDGTVKSENLFETPEALGAALANPMKGDIQIRL